MARSFEYINENGVYKESSPQKDVVEAFANAAPFQIGGYSQPVLPPDPVNARIQENNAISSVVNSEERRVEAEEKVYDNAYESRLSAELSCLRIMPVPNSIKPNVKVSLSSLPSDMKELVQLTAMKFNIDVAAVLHVMLGGLFTAARGCYEVAINKRYKEIVTEYLLLVLPSGGRKSALVELFRSVFERVQHARQFEYNQKMPASSVSQIIKNKMEMKVINSRLAAYELEGMTRAEISEEAAIIAEEFVRYVDNNPIEPWQVNRLLVDNPTAKMLALNMAEQNEAIAVFEPEPGLFKNHRIRADQDNIYLKGYSAEPFSDDVTAKKASVVMDSPVLAITICAQDGVAEEIFGRKKICDDGLLPRFLTVSCPVIYSQQGYVNEDRFEALLGRYEDIVERILQTEFQQQIHGHGKVRSQLRLSSEAEFLRWKFDEKVQQLLMSGAFKGFEAFGNKLVGHAVRIAGALHLWEHENPAEAEISERTMRAAIELADFYKVHAAHMFCSDISKGHRFAVKALVWIDKLQKYRFTENDIRRGTGTKIADIRAGLAFLERNNYLCRHTRKKTTYCVVHPQYLFNGSTFIA